MKVLFDTYSPIGEMHSEWLRIVSRAGREFIDSDSSAFVSFLIDSATDRNLLEEWDTHERCELIGFPRRSDVFAVRATEAALLSHVAKSHEVDVIVTSGRSYALGIPLVVVRIDEAMEDGDRMPTEGAALEICVATAMASTVVTASTDTAARIQMAYPFFGTEDVVVSSSKMLPELICQATRRAYGRAGWQQTAEIQSLLEDYQSRIRRIQV